MYFQQDLILIILSNTQKTSLQSDTSNAKIRSSLKITFYTVLDIAQHHTEMKIE